MTPCVVSLRRDLARYEASGAAGLPVHGDRPPCIPDPQLFQSQSVVTGSGLEEVYTAVARGALQDGDDAGALFNSQ